MSRKANILRSNNAIHILNCDHPKCASDFLITLQAAINAGNNKILIQSSAKAVFPNACVPIRGVIDHYERKGITFTYDLDRESYFSNCCFITPLNKTREELQAEKQPFGKIFMYENSGQVADITQAFVNTISHQLVCGDGVLGGLNWCINEVMDNVLLHSEAGHGFVMAQYHPSTCMVVFCIYVSTHLI